MDLGRSYSPRKSRAAVLINPGLFPVLVHGHVDDFGFGDADAVAGCAAMTFGLDDDADGDGSCADADGLGVEADQVADEDGFVKDDFAHGDGDEARHARMTMSLDCARHVNVAQDNAAEDRPLRIGVAWQERDANCRVCVGVHRNKEMRAEG
jgi:hypothetical protein